MSSHSSDMIPSAADREADRKDRGGDPDARSASVENHEAAAHLEEKSEPSPDQLEHEVEAIREKLGGLVSELDHRRHRLNPLPMLRRNSLAIAVAGALVVGLCAGGIVWGMNRQARRQRTLAARAARLRRTLASNLAKVSGAPAAAREAAKPSVARKVVTAALSAAAVMAARRLTEKATEQLFNRAPVQTADPHS